MPVPVLDFSGSLARDCQEQSQGLVEVRGPAAALGRRCGRGRCHYEDEELAIEAGINEDLSEQAASMPEEEQEAIYALQGAEDHAAAKRAIKDIITDLSGSSGALQDAAAKDTDMVQPASADLQPMELRAEALVPFQPHHDLEYSRAWRALMLV